MHDRYLVKVSDKFWRENGDYTIIVTLLDRHERMLGEKQVPAWDCVPDGILDLLDARGEQFVGMLPDLNPGRADSRTFWIVIKRT